MAALSETAVDRKLADERAAHRTWIVGTVYASNCKRLYGMSRHRVWNIGRSSRNGKAFLVFSYILVLINVYLRSAKINGKPPKAFAQMCSCDRLKLRQLFLDTTSLLV